MSRIAPIVLAVALASCGVIGDDLGQETGDLTGVGPHATAASARIVYPDDAQALGIPYEDVESVWNELAGDIPGAPQLEPVADPGPGEPSAVAESPSSGIAVDVIAQDGTVVIAQLSVVDGAGDEDDPANVAAVRAFLEAVGLDPAVVLDALGVDESALHGEDQDVEAVYRSGEATVFYAANEDTVLVGVFGPWSE